MWIPMQLRINPTRMALLRLRKRLVIARRGHKLLKDKLEGLIQIFMPMVEEYGNLRTRVDSELSTTLKLFILAGALANEKHVETALDECYTTVTITSEMKSFMSVVVPELSLKEFEIHPTYSTVLTTSDFDSACKSLREIFPLLLTLANLEEAIIRLANEIEKTRRRVNALEYTLIPALAATVKAISNKLEEYERGDRARLMKIKDMLSMGEVL
jgi:V/A-type H+/Na+-transporting ATPase subunit D